MAYKDKEKEHIARQRAKRKYYSVHKESEQNKARARMRERRIASYAYVNLIKESTPCLDCNQTFDAVCMDFDHCKGDKKANVSRLVNEGRPLEVIKAEIDKCELVCANCHRIRTRDRTNADCDRLDLPKIDLNSSTNAVLAAAT